jgi:AAA domain/Bifunctional DNA primase/polymerase, N-terminal
MPHVPDEVLALGVPLVALKPGSKQPRSGGHGHLEAEIRNNATVWKTEDENYGIVMSPGLLVVDFDREDTEGWKDRLPATWRVKTRRGEHWMFKVPPDFVASTSKFASGDLKTKGYVVGPGSIVEGQTYEILDAQTPQDAPNWLLDYAKSTRSTEDTVGTTEGGVDSIADGSGRDDFLAGLAGFGRRKGLSEKGLRHLLAGAIEQGVIESGDSPKTVADIKRIARSAMRWESVTEDSGTYRDSIVFADHIDLVGPPVRWWVHGFIPRGELVMMYGKGGIGKSTFASWLAAEIVRKDGTVLSIGVEETFTKFAWRAYLGGADRSRLSGMNHASRLLLPEGIVELEEIIKESKIDFIYFDSIYSHMGGRDGQNAAERARLCLGVLAELAQSKGVTILANFHENKAGQFLGSVEMVNVARCVLKASREHGKPLMIETGTADAKSNLTAPEYRMAFGGKVKQLVDAETGEVQLEEDEDGKLKPMEMLIAERLENVPIGSFEIGELDESPDY